MDETLLSFMLIGATAGMVAGAVPAVVGATAPRTLPETMRTEPGSKLRPPQAHPSPRLPGSPWMIGPSII